MRGRALGAYEAARAMNFTMWYRVPVPLPPDPAGRRLWLAGYAAGIEDVLS